MQRKQTLRGKAFNEKKFRFAAIDFETASYSRDSACALSLVLVEGLKVRDQKTILIRPPQREFIFTYLHGISWEDVSEMPDFGGWWPEISSRLQGVDFIAAHNASFDRGVMAACCQTFSVAPPGNPYVCTVQLARKLWNVFPTKLPHVCSYLNIPLNHHDAASDALACAKIVISALKEAPECLDTWGRSLAGAALRS